MPAVVDKAVVALNNLSVRLRRTRCRPDQVLVLFAACLQRSECERRLDGGLSNCARCGKCAVSRFLDLADRYGVQVFRATGGREAAARGRDPNVKAIVAVACRKELSDGLKVAFPKPTLLLELGTPNGPCKDTCIDFDAVRAAVARFLR